MSGSSMEEIGDDDGLQIKPPQQHHRHRRDDRQRRWPGEEQDSGYRYGSSRNVNVSGDSRRREYYEPLRVGDRGHPRNQRLPDSVDGTRDRRVEQDRNRKRRYEDFGSSTGSSRRNVTDSGSHRSRGQPSDPKRTDLEQNRDSRDPDDLRSKLHKSMKQKRKHLEIEEQKALREIEKRNRREQKNEHDKNLSSGTEKKRRKHKSKSSSPVLSPSHSTHELEMSDREDEPKIKHPPLQSKTFEELDEIMVIDDIVKSSPEMEELESESKRYEEHPYHSDVSSGDEADRDLNNEDKGSHKSANSESPSSKSDSDSDGSSSSSKSGGDEDSEDDESKNADSKTYTDSASVEKVEVEVVKEKGVLEVDESLLTDVDRAIKEVGLLPPYFPAVQGCRRVEEFSLLNRIEEGTYGVVYRAKDRRTNEVVALKRLKMEKEKDGFPITSLREINTLLKAQHENIVTVREIVVGSNTDKIFLVMDYVEHDLKALMETLKQKNQKFMIQEVKCLMIQLLRAVAHLHDNWILHRDLKTSNLLLSHKGILKVGDFGLAREYGSPLKAYTPIVVTLWYRAPELLLGSKEYSTPIDVWSVGCIFGELIKLEPTFPGKSEANELNLIFQTLGTPNDRIWPGYSQLPLLQKMTFVEQPMNKLKTRFGLIGDKGIDLMNKLLTYNPAKRITAEEALNHLFFKESPLPIDPSVFPTWPAKSELGHRKAPSSPKPPSGGRQFKDLREDDDSCSGFFLGSTAADRRLPMGGGFSLKF